MGSVVQRVDAPAEGSHRCGACGETFPADYRLCPRDGTVLGPQQGGIDPLVGVILGSTFRLLRPLARGGMARLYEAEHLRVARRFAVKVLSEAYTDRPELVARFEREARALAPLRSPHVVDVVDVLPAPDGRPCIVTELLRGEDLARRLHREGALPLPEALSVAIQMCRGLDAAHAHGVVHRDLKPSNVFLTRRPDGRVTVKLVDFGVAKLLSDPALTQTDAVVGTPAYMPPEQARAAARVTEASDVYGVGAVLYHMLSGRPPYPDADATTLLRRVLSEEPVRLRAMAPEVPEAVEVVVQAAMARDPGARVSTATELQSLLSDLTHAHGAANVSVEHCRTPEEAIGPKNNTSDTRSLRNGIECDSSELTRRAGRARPLALAAAAGAVVGGALLGALLMGAGLAGLDVDPGSRAYGWLVHAAGLCMGSLVTWALIVRARDAWRSAIAVESLRQRWVGGLLCGAATLGGCLGVIAGASTLSGATPSLGARTLGLAAMVALAAATWATRSRTGA